MSRFALLLLATFAMIFLGATEVQSQCYGGRYYSAPRHYRPHAVRYGYRAPVVYGAYPRRVYRAPNRYYRPSYGYRGYYPSRAYGYRPSGHVGYRGGAYGGGVTVRIRF